MESPHPVLSKAQKHSNLTFFFYFILLVTRAPSENSSKIRTDNRSNSVPRLYGHQGLPSGVAKGHIPALKQNHYHTVPNLLGIANSKVTQNVPRSSEYNLGTEFIPLSASILKIRAE
jgi:hypothetical protein